MPLSSSWEETKWFLEKHWGGVRWSHFISELLWIYQNHSKDVALEDDVFGHYYSKSALPMSVSPPDNFKNICWILALNFYRIN